MSEADPVETREAECRRCHNEFDYEWRGRARWFCDECRLLARRESSRQKIASFNLVEGEARVEHGRSALCSASIRTITRVSEILSVSVSRAQQLERSAVLKIRNNAYLKWWRAECDGKPPAWPCPPAPSSELSLGQEVEQWLRRADELRAAGLAEEAVEIEALARDFVREWERVINSKTQIPNPNAEEQRVLADGHKGAEENL